MVISKECFVHELLNYHPRGVNLKNNFGVIYQLCFTCVNITKIFSMQSHLSRTKMTFVLLRQIKYNVFICKKDHHLRSYLYCDRKSTAQKWTKNFFLLKKLAFSIVLISSPKTSLWPKSILMSAYNKNVYCVVFVV